MKAKEAPEKLYLHPTANGKVGASWLAFSLTNEDIEYIRTDAFIEKTCAWLKESITNNQECNRIISKKRVITMGEIIKDFRKYMEGE